MAEGLNDDFSRPAAADTAAMDWQPSPSATVWRKRLELSGPAEQGRVTSVVRYDPGSRFHSHPHPDGEEILVLDGVFSDESGDYPKGSYLLNPEGFVHAPGSTPGCVLFVKLRQYPGTSRRHVALSADEMAWQADDAPGVARRTLYAEPGHPETMALLRLDAGAAVPLAAGGNELFVVSGDIAGAEIPLKEGAWLRLPPGDTPVLTAIARSVIYLKSRHLTALVS